MAISKLIRDDVSQPCRERGRAYFSNRLVKLLNHGKFLARFQVHGTENYIVEFDFKLGLNELMSTCTCPHFQKGQFCKHIWACVLATDEQNLFPGTKSLKRLSLKHSLLETREVSESEDEEPYVFEPPAKNPASSWQGVLERAKARADETQPALSYMGKKVAQFVVDPAGTDRAGTLCLRVFAYEVLKNGVQGASRPLPLTRSSTQQLKDANDREIFRYLIGVANSTTSYYYDYGQDSVEIPAEDIAGLLRRLNGAGKQLVALTNSSSYAGRGFHFSPYTFSERNWSLELQLRAIDDSYFLTCHLSDGTTTKPIRELLATIDGYILFSEFAAPSDLYHHPEWLELFAKKQELEITKDEVDAFLQTFFANPKLPPLALPEEFQFIHCSDMIPQVRLSISSIRQSAVFQCHLEFVYGGISQGASSPSIDIFDVKNRMKIRRDMTFEQKAAAAMKDFGIIEPWANVTADGLLSDKNLWTAIEKALAAGWEVMLQQKFVRPTSAIDIQMTSGIDWFDLNGDFKYGQATISLPQLLQSIRKGEKYLHLAGGELGALPSEWLKKFGPLVELAKETKGQLRLNKVQAIFLSASLEDTASLKGDRQFKTLKQVIANFRDIKPTEPGPAFQGRLRGYQKSGLTWIQKLAEQNLGGILADDMGLGKTVQVLAQLQSIHSQSKRPTLIVAPKSLIFNWMKEAEKFTPNLKLHAFTGSKRSEQLKDLQQFDVILTTYQSLRRDIEFLKDVEFEYFVLDEAQYIKNAKSQGAMACRLIQARHKLALTGTPVENSLLDLYSILGIVLPGLVTEAQAQRWAKENDPTKLSSLSRALTPFLLRRNKAQVLKDLPEKSEQVLYCELSPGEMRRYKEIRDYYWDNLRKKVEGNGLSRSKIEVLEALLRLRQAACHQGLLDKKLSHSQSSKFEILFEQMDSIIKDGHKALVFSQFTSLLALFKTELDRRQITYEYLDGKTKDRELRVSNFQNDAGIKLFLLSLKAGGVGLNLTAADYVFILDPWWNPAAEAQAIDRCHRIGQNKKVMAYRIIAKDTVEEKILQLQEKKRILANTIVSDNQSILKSLKFEDLAQLFS